MDEAALAVGGGSFESVVWCWCFGDGAVRHNFFRGMHSRYSRPRFHLEFSFCFGDLFFPPNLVCFWGTFGMFSLL